MPTIEQVKEKYRINEVLPISLITLKKQKIYLFHEPKEKVDYSLCTDGNIEHIETWVTKKPYQFDSFLEGCQTVKRFTFDLDDANIVLIQKKYQNQIVRNLYIDESNIDKILMNSLYQLSINQNEKIKIKRIGEIIWKSKG